MPKGNRAQRRHHTECKKSGSLTRGELYADDGEE